MKTKTNSKKVSCIPISFYSLIVKGVFLIAFILTGVLLPVNAQLSQDKKHSWWFGIASGANINFYTGSTQELNSDLTAPVIFDKGSGAGLYLASVIAFHRPDTKWGVVLQAGYDSRKGSFDEKNADCGCTDDLSTGLSYVTLEPSLRFAPFKSDFYFFGGPRLAFNLNKSFIYSKGIYTGFSDQDAHQDYEMNFGNMNKAVILMQIGAGYDIPVSQRNDYTQYVISPFISFQPYFGQNPRTIETWKVTTFRFGVALKQLHRQKIQAKKKINSVPLF